MDQNKLIYFDKIYICQIKMKLFTQSPHGEIYMVVKIIHVSRKKQKQKQKNSYYSLGNIQHCLHFKCTEVNIFGTHNYTESVTNHGIIQGVCNLYIV